MRLQILQNFGLYILIALISCNSKIETKESSTTLEVSSILIDSSFGYPYPKNYDWETWVKNGGYPVIPTKQSGSRKPLVELMNKKSHELYRINLGLIWITINNDSSSRLMKVQKDSVFTWNQKSPWSFPDSVVHVERDIILSSSDFNAIMKKIKAIQLFQKTTIDSVPRFICDGYSIEIEGVKNNKYNLVFRVLPDKKYEPELYSLRKWLLERI